MLIRGKVLKGKYFDSVTLMRVGKALTALDGVADAAVVMGTAENREILAAADLLLDDFATAGGADLLVSLRCADAAAGDAALAQLDELELDDDIEAFPQQVANRVGFAVPSGNRNPPPIPTQGTRQGRSKQRE